MYASGLRDTKSTDWAGERQVESAGSSLALRGLTLDPPLDADVFDQARQEQSQQMGRRQLPLRGAQR